MNMEDEEEYADFYDFSKTYENHPLLLKDSHQHDHTHGDEEQIKKDKGEESQGGQNEDGWEDCDLEDASADDNVEEGNIEMDSTTPP